MARIPLWKLKKAQTTARQRSVTQKRTRDLHDMLFKKYLEREIDVFELCNKMKYQCKPKKEVLNTFPSSPTTSKKGVPHVLHN